MKRPAADTDAVGVRRGRSAPTHTDIHDWVIYSGVSPSAIALYVILRSHVNRQRGDDLVWTSTLTLAVMMGLGRGDKIKPYLKELEDIKAVEVIRGGLHRRNEYIVHALPPEGYKGPLNGPAWYELHKPLLTLKREAEKSARDARRANQRATKATGDTRTAAEKHRSEPVTPKTGEQAEGPSVTLKTGEQVTLKTGEPVTPKTGREPRSGFEPDEVETPSPSASSSPPEWATGPEPEEEKKIPSTSDVQAAKPADAGPQLDDWERQLHAELMRQRPSWSPSVLREVLASPVIRERPDRGLVRRAFLLGAKTSKTTTPRRLLHDLCPHWDQALKEMREESVREGGGAAGQDAAAPKMTRRALALGAYRASDQRSVSVPPAASGFHEARARLAAKVQGKTGKLDGPIGLDRLKAAAERVIPEGPAGENAEA